MTLCNVNGDDQVGEFGVHTSTKTQLSRILAITTRMSSEYCRI